MTYTPSSTLVTFFFFPILLCFNATDLAAQLYHDELLSKEEYTLEEIVEKVEQHYDNIGRDRGKGYKQFQRWKYWAERNLDASGNVRRKFRSLQSYTEFNQHNHSASRFEGGYEELGPLSATNTSTWSSGLGRITSIGLDANDDNHIIVGSQTGGIWKTTDLGVNWTPLYDYAALIDVCALEISHANSDHYWAGLEGDLVRSIDGGASWTAISGVPTDIYNTIEMDPKNSGILFAIAESSGRVLKSSDGGESFSEVLDHYSRMYDLAFHPTHANIVYTAGNNALYKSTNGGENFTEITNGPWAGNSINNTMMIGITPDAPSSIYLLEEKDGGFNAIYHSADEGASWTTLTDNTCGCQNMLGYNQNDNGGQAPRDMDIIVSPVDANIIHIAGVETWRSFDFGQNWSQTTSWNVPNASNFIHADIDLLIYDNNRIVAGTDGGIYYSTDEATTWTNITFGLGIRQFYRIGASQTEIDRVSGGSQDNGTGILRDSNWYNWLGADGMETFIDWSNENNIYGTTQFGYLYRSQDGGQTGSAIPRPGGLSCWVTPFEQDPIDPSIIYTAREEVFKSANNGESWEQISSFDNGTINELKIAPSNNNILYVGDGTVFRYTFDGGQTWNSNDLSGFINYIAVHPFDPLRVSVALSFSSNKVIESTDGGATWTNLTANLPNVGIECVYYEPIENGGLFCAGNPGIYYTTDTSDPDWEDNSHNLPNVRVTELEIRNQIMYVATYGRGLWKFEFACNGSQVGMACTDNNPCTINDVFDEDCNCVGELEDSDHDGVCDSMDVCLGGDDNIDSDHDGIPDFCDDCAALCPDSDCDTVCDADDLCPGGNDTQDIDGDGIPDFCDDCDERIGQSCDDGNPFTVNDTYDANCNCVGELNDSDEDGVCDTNDLCDGSDDNIDTDGDRIPDGCDTCDNASNIGVNLVLKLDNFPEETRWEIKNSEGAIVASGGNYSSITDANIIIEQICDLGLGCFEFTIFDAYGDGICCRYGLGSYSLLDGDGNELAHGGEFNQAETTPFCLDCINAGASCDDGNPCTSEDTYDDDCNCVGEYTDSDNDGYCIGDDPDDNDPCIPEECLALECNAYDYESFENGLGIWNSGGVDAMLVNNVLVANTGAYAVMIFDNSGSSSSFLTNTLDLSAYEAIELSFHYRARSMEIGEEFLLEISTDGGTSYDLFKSWVSGSDFENLLPYSEHMLIDDIILTNQTIIRFRCDASDNNDQVFLDDISIQVCANAIELAMDLPMGQITNTESESDEVEIVQTYETSQLDIIADLNTDILLIPNPVTDWMKIKGISGDDNLITIFSSQGKKMLQVQALNNTINLSDLPNGIYFLSVWQNNQAIVKRFVKIE